LSIRGRGDHPLPHHTKGGTMTEQKVERLLTVAEVAELVQMAEGSVYRWISQGKLRHVKLGHRAVRVRASDLEEFIEARLKGGSDDRPADFS